MPAKLRPLPFTIRTVIKALGADVSQSLVPQIRIIVDMHGSSHSLSYMGIESHGGRTEAFVTSGFPQR